MRNIPIKMPNDPYTPLKITHLAKVNIELNHPYQEREKNESFAIWHSFNLHVYTVRIYGDVYYAVSTVEDESGNVCTNWPFSLF